MEKLKGKAVRVIGIGFLLFFIIYLNFFSVSTLYVGVFVKEEAGTYRINYLDEVGAGYIAGLQIGDKIVRIDGQDSFGDFIVNRRVEQVSSITVERNNEKLDFIFTHSLKLMNQYITYVLMPLFVLMLSVLAMIISNRKLLYSNKHFELVFFLLTLSLCLVTAWLYGKQFLYIRHIYTLSLLLLPYLYFKLVLNMVVEQVEVSWEKKVRQFFGFSTIVLIILYYLVLTFLPVFSGQIFLVSFFLTIALAIILLLFLKHKVKDTMYEKRTQVMSRTLVVSVLPFISLYLIPDLVVGAYSLSLELSLLFLLFIPITLLYVLVTDNYYFANLTINKLLYYFFIAIILAFLCIVVILAFGFHTVNGSTVVQLFGSLLIISMVFLFIKEVLDRRLRNRLFSDRTFYLESLTKLNSLIRTENNRDHILKIVELEMRDVLGMKDAHIVQIRNSSDKEADHSNSSKQIRIEIGREGMTRYEIVGRIHGQRKLSSIQNDWVRIVNSYLTMKFENLKQIEEVVSELEKRVNQKEHDQWIENLFFNWAEKERMNLALDLHDTVLQDMILHRRQLERHRIDLEKGYDQQFYLSQTKQLEENAEDMIAITRETLQELQPPDERFKDLKEVLESFISNKVLRSSYKINLVYQVDGAISPQLYRTIFRLIQELVSNGIKHAEGTQINIQIEDKGEHLFISYEDDGKGIKKEEDLNKEGHFGIFGMKQRVSARGGTIHISNIKTTGLRIYITLPL